MNTSSHSHTKKHMLIAVDFLGTVRIAQTVSPLIPDNFQLEPGEVAFVVEVLDVKARHTHEVSGSNRAVKATS